MSLCLAAAVIHFAVSAEARSGEGPLERREPHEAEDVEASGERLAQARELVERLLVFGVQRVNEAAQSDHGRGVEVFPQARLARRAPLPDGNEVLDPARVQGEPVAV